MQEKAVETIGSVSVESVKQIMDWLKQAVELGKEQAPQVAQEIVRMGIAESWFYIAVFSVLAIGAGVLFYLSRQKYEDSDVNAVFFGLGFGLSVFWFLATAGNVYWLIYIYTAPRLYVLSELKKLIG